MLDAPGVDVGTATTSPGQGPGATPVFANGCSGWLHAATVGAGSDVAVLICPALLQDALDSYHALRMLAEDCAAAGHPAMRFEYPGTGDSDDVTNSGHWTAWLQSVHAASDWLRHATGARRLVLCGLRIGATLATLAAEGRDDVAGLVLLAPVMRGRGYVRQLRIEAQLQSGTQSATGEGLDIKELQLGAETVNLISQVDLRRARLSPGMRVLVFSQADSNVQAECVTAWNARGAEATCTGFDPLAAMLRHNWQGDAERMDFAPVLDWIRRAVPAQPIPLARLPEPGAAVLERFGCREVPVLFGAGRRLFGILCRPDGRAADEVVIIGNTGRDPHYGSARFGVEFARRLAARGTASFRIDFAGLGDSMGPAGRENVLSHLFEMDRTADISAAIDALEPLGYRRFAMHGLCSGAYHAWRGGLADPRLTTLLLVNLPVFSWRAGDTVDFVGRRAYKPGFYLAQLTRKSVWARVVQGKTDFRGIIHAQGERVYSRLYRIAAHLADRLGGARPQSAVHQAMATLSRRGTRTLLLFAVDDLGLDAVEVNFGRGGAGLRAFKGISMQIVPGLDHILSRRHMRQVAAEIMMDFLAGPAGGGPAASPGQDDQPRG